MILKITIVIFLFWIEISMACHEEAMGGEGGIWPTLKGHNPSTRSNGLLVLTESTTAASSTTTSCDTYTSFLEKNYDLIAETIARGNGIFIDAIISYYGCSEENIQGIEKLFKRNYSQIFNSPLMKYKIKDSHNKYLYLIYLNLLNLKHH